MDRLNKFGFTLCMVFAAASSLHNNIFKKDVSMLNVLCSQGVTPDFGETVTVFECARWCHTNGAQCRSFFYSKNRTHCETVPAILYSNVTCEYKTGYSYFKEFVFRSRFGDVCSNDGQCVMAAGKCINGACSCVAGYSHDPVMGSCVPDCVRYGSTFIRHQNYYLAQPLVSPIVNVSLAYCKELCSNSTVCRGFNHLALNEQCKQLEVTPLTDPDTIRSSSVIDYYYRNCA